MSKSTQDLNTHCIAFYNLENLFDTKDDVLTGDNDFLPYSRKRWTDKRFQNKIKKLGATISKIGKDKTINAPTILGVAEVENRAVMEALIESEDLGDINYGIVHYDSSDERGIDVGLIYNKNHFEVLHSETFVVYLEDEDGERDYTRDILLVSGKLQDETIHILVNHWPSRRDGEDETNHKRVTAAQKVAEIISKIRHENPEAKVLVMGDFNDNPDNDSLQLLVNENAMYNPMETIWSPERGSQIHDFKWNMFDQILCSVNFLSSDKTKLRYDHADVFDEHFLTQFKGKYKGQPFRTYVGKKYKGGISDHFPVYMILEVEA